MATSRRILLLYVTLLSVLSAIAAPVDYETAQSLEARKATTAKVAPAQAAPALAKVAPALAKAAPAPVAVAPAPAKAAPATAAPGKAAPGKTTSTTSPPATAAKSCPVKPATAKTKPTTPKAKTLARRTLTGTGEHQVSLLRSNVGTDHEHWALFFHPSAANADGTFTGTLIDAVTDAGAAPNSVLVIDERENKSRGNINTATRTDILTSIATVADGAAAEALIAKAKTAVPTRKPPAENCVDFTSNAMNKMAGSARNGGISITAFSAIFKANQKQVRAETACNFACRAEGDDNA